MSAQQSLDGVLPLDKPRGPTSHDAVAIARRALRTRRIGHTGTLDPFASGLLLLCIGSTTRLAEYITGLDKSYDAVVRLGAATDTDDETGTIVATSDASHVTRTAVEDALMQLRGEVMQLPPQYSAKKVDGRRAYSVAREGGVALLTPVHVRIDTLEITSFEPPLVGLHVRCSSGTYIRAIARDLGQALGTGAHLASLRRTSIGSHHVDDAIRFDALSEDPAAAARRLIPPLEAVRHLPRIDVDATDAEHIRHGRRFTCDAPAGTVVVAHDGALLAIADVVDGVLHPRKVLAA